jgi:hypothetical protein
MKGNYGKKLADIIPETVHKSQVSDYMTWKTKKSKPFDQVQDVVSLNVIKAADTTVNQANQDRYFNDKRQMFKKRKIITVILILGGRGNALLREVTIFYGANN